MSFVVIVGILYWFRDLFIPLALSVLLTFLLAPVATRLERLGAGRIVAAVCAVALAILVVGGIGYTFTGQLADLANQLPQYRATISKKLETIRHPNIGPFSRATATISGLLDEMEGKTSALAPLAETPKSPLPAQPANTFDFVRTLLGQVISMLGTGAVVFVCVLFFLIDRNDIRDRLISLTGRQRFHTTTRALNDAGQRVSSYLLMQLVVNVTLRRPDCPWPVSDRHPQCGTLGPALHHSAIRALPRSDPRCRPSDHTLVCRIRRMDPANSYSGTFSRDGDYQQ